MASIVLEEAEPAPTARDLLRSALGDPRLDVVYWRTARGAWIDETGFPVKQAVLGSDRCLTPLERAGDWVAAVLHDPALRDEPERLRAACAAVRRTIDDERLKAELRAQLRDEQASRARVLAASDRQRRRFERNVHDGAQQRLVGLALMLRLASKRTEGDSAATASLAEAVAELDEAIEDLRELARGLHPAIVNDAGLVAALESLAEHPGTPVELVVDVPGRLPDLVEVAAYYLVAECLANANKHSGAGRITVEARLVGGVLEIEVADDGCGGAAISGSGLVGLDDRLGALGGRLLIDSDPGLGTTVMGAIPLKAATDTALPLVDDLLLRVVALDDTGTPPSAGSAASTRGLGGDDDRRRRALKWVVWQNFAAPGEIVDAQPEEVDLLYAKGMLLLVGGNRHISTQRRNWIIGYLTSAGYSESVLEAARSYDDGDDVVELLRRPPNLAAQRVLLYDSLRACAFDSDVLMPDAFDPVLRAADAVGISRDVVADLHELVIEEHRLRQRRHDVVVVPAMPKVLNDSLATIRAAAGEEPLP